MFESRRVRGKILCEQHEQSINFRYRRAIGGKSLPDFDPFILLDDLTVGPPAGLGDHAHCGVETVTYCLPMELQPRTALHANAESVWAQSESRAGIAFEDCRGKAGVTGIGEVQWLTVGRGIMHSEMPADDEMTRALQLWINLAPSHKKCETQYQLQGKPPVATADGITVHVLAGEYEGVRSTVQTSTPLMMLHCIMEQGSKMQHTIPPDWNLLIYVLGGEAAFGSDLVVDRTDAHHVLVFPAADATHSNADGIFATVAEGEATPASFLLLAGKPIHAPICKRGPFYLNSLEEIQKAVQNLQDGIGGFQGAPGWHSQIAKQCQSISVEKGNGKGKAGGRK